LLLALHLCFRIYSQQQDLDLFSCVHYVAAYSIEDVRLARVGEEIILSNLIAIAK